MTARRTPQPSQDRSQPANPTGALQLALHGLLACLWVFVCLSFSSRGYFIHTYTVVPLLPSYYEPFNAPTSSFLFSLCFIGLWMLLSFQANRQSTFRAAGVWRWLTTSPAVWLACAVSLPLAMIVLRGAKPTLPTSYFELLWFAIWSGWSYFHLGARVEILKKLSPRIALATTIGLALAAGLYWYLESVRYHSDFLLGFNDFGHFTQRIANTAAGRGILKESPVLPPFWDHFNPGLLILVPLWKIWPSVKLVFLLQAIALASPAIAVHLVARRFGASPLSQTLWASAWLLQPVVGQSNLAYTYGWHPISLAIGPMLLCFWFVLMRRYVLAAMMAFVAISMEEGPIVVLACLCGAIAFEPLWQRLSVIFRRTTEHKDSPLSPNLEASQLTSVQSLLGPRTAMILAISLAIIFVAVFKLSGLAEFQTGRFHKLGANLFEIALSPVLKPHEFWGQIFRPNKAAFLLSLFLPLNLFALYRGWRIVIATALPLMVLIVWDHAPAASIAFQYTSAVLPVLWLAAIAGANRWQGLSIRSAERPSEASHWQSTSQSAQQVTQQPIQPAASQRGSSTSDYFQATSLGALASGALLSLYVGALPFSLDAIMDVKGRTYFDPQANLSGPIPVFDRVPWSQRSATSDAGRWLHEQLDTIRIDGGEVLATTRIAAHLVGNRDVETVGQFHERSNKLAQLQDRKDQPLLAYQWIVLDRIEMFQQTIQQTMAIEDQARELGFQVYAQEHQIVIFRRPSGLELRAGR